MGSALSWLAVKGKSPDVVAQALGLTPTGETAIDGESLFIGRSLSSGWFLLVIHQFGHPFVNPPFPASLSDNCDLVTCSIEEHVMFCRSERWQNGINIWHIEHDAQQGFDHLNRAGNLPDGYFAIEREFAEEQKKAGGNKADTDYFFEIPLKTAKLLVGFKHDESSAGDEDFEIFNGPPPSSSAGSASVRRRRSWWKLWT